MTKIDLRSQVQGVLPAANGGVDNAQGEANTRVILRMWNDNLTGASLASGTLVTKTAAIPTLHATTIAGEPIIGVVVGSYPDAGGALVLGTCAYDDQAAIVVSGLVSVLTTSAGSVGDYLSTSGTAGKAVTTGATKSAGTWGRVIGAENANSCYALLVEVGSSAEPTYAVPSVVLGTAAVQGVAASAVRTDATIVAFDATAPTTIVFGDTAATGSTAVASRRDHKHGIPVIVDSTVPTTQAFGDAPVAGSSSVASHVDHKHGMPTAAVGEILIVDSPSTPLIFADLVQNEDQNDLLYAD